MSAPFSIYRMDKKELLRQIPKIDALLQTEEVLKLCKRYPRWIVVEGIRKIIAEKREEILKGKEIVCDKKAIIDELMSRIDLFALPSLRRVINATGVVLHTNLGRAPLANEAIEQIKETAPFYCNLEYNLSEGKRGSRYEHVVEILKKLTDAPSALVVNNNAAAVFLVLNTLAKGKEVIVSRGELIEIGGSFRLPDVMTAAGAILKEVGTTNKTKLEDYKKAINENTALILKAHTSNYRILGFTESVPLKELVKLGREYNIPVYEDLGSGLFIDVRKFGLPYEPTVKESLKSGVDVISFSGDKLLGATQAGIILGREDVVEKIRKNPINRALRIDKLTLAALEATLRLYMEENAEKKIPALAMLSEKHENIKKRAEKLLTLISEKLSFKGYKIDITKDISTVGGGALPLAELPTWCVTVSSEKIPPEEIEKSLRTKPIIPVISRIKNDAVYIDMRTVREFEIEITAKSILEALS